MPVDDTSGSSPVAAVVSATEAVAAESSNGGCLGPRIDFNGRRIQVVQVGLGTNSTFVQNLSGAQAVWNKNISCLLETVTETRPWLIEGIGVEPVKEHAEKLRAGFDSLMPHVALVQAALGEVMLESSSTIHCLTEEDRASIVSQVPVRLHKGMLWDLGYLENMSCVGGEHPLLREKREEFRSWYGVDLPFTGRSVEVWSWDRLARELNFCGCELLIVDTEGHDTSVLRSMIQHCAAQEVMGLKQAWPRLIEFESQGWGNWKENSDAEWNIVRQLENYGYVLICYSNWSTSMVLAEVLYQDNRVKRWTNLYKCDTCHRNGVFPYYSDDIGTRCYMCYPQWSQRPWLCISSGRYGSYTSGDRFAEASIEIDVDKTAEHWWTGYKKAAEGRSSANDTWYRPCDDRLHRQSSWSCSWSDGRTHLSANDSSGNGTSSWNSWAGWKTGRCW